MIKFYTNSGYGLFTVMVETENHTYWLNLVIKKDRRHYGYKVIQYDISLNYEFGIGPLFLLAW